jgi:protein TonB
MQVSSVDTGLTMFFCEAGQLPEFPGGLTKLAAFAKGNIQYPETAVNDRIEGSVILQFVIDEKGKVTNARIVKSVRNDIDSACLGMLRQMPDWEPARFGPKAIPVNERWKIKFLLLN